VWPSQSSLCAPLDLFLFLTQRLPLAANGTFGHLAGMLHEQPAALAARAGHGPLPVRPVTFRVVGAAIEGLAAPGALHHDVAAAVGAIDADLLHNLLGVAA